jgi:hypothetical protein
MLDFALFTPPDLNNVWHTDSVSRWLAGSTGADLVDFSRELWLQARFPTGCRYHQGTETGANHSTGRRHA